jgi:DNA polymerase
VDRPLAQEARAVVASARALPEPRPAPPPPAAVAPASAVQAPLLEDLPFGPQPTLEAVREALGDCRRCRLCEGRSHIVFGDGDPRARRTARGCPSWAARASCSPR